MENDNIRYILADEVGLGKTIEAGMIIKELKTRGL
jgi:SNF2 family DNA or RNA helicase